MADDQQSVRRATVLKKTAGDKYLVFLDDRGNVCEISGRSKVFVLPPEMVFPPMAFAVPAADLPSCNDKVRTQGFLTFDFGSNINKLILDNKTVLVMPRVSVSSRFSRRPHPQTTDVNLGQAHCLASRAQTLDLWLEITEEVCNFGIHPK
jgi:hypothetical protein